MMFEAVHRYVLVAKLHSYLRDVDASVRVLTDGLQRYPNSAHLLRHRGHFRVVRRDFTSAKDDLEQALAILESMDDEIEYYQRELVPEMERAILGLQLDRLREPRRNTDDTLAGLHTVYKGTLKWSTWYHYGLAHYLSGDFDEAARIYAMTLEHSADDDMRVATLDWHYMSLRRAGRAAEAEALLNETDPAIMHVNEPSYQKRMRMYRGELEAEELLSAAQPRSRALATQGYGVGNWYYYSGQTSRAVDVFERVIALGDTDAFGHIAAEIDLQTIASRT